MNSKEPEYDETAAEAGTAPEAVSESEAESPALSADKLQYAYGNLQAVKEISFTVARGEIFSLLGPNGAGKSTTIKMLTGQLIPKSGTINILGIPVSGHNPEVHRRMGVCFEEKNLYLQMSAVENLRFFADLFGIRSPDIEGILEKVDLLSRAKDRVSTYSKGMRQRLMMARALINDPEILFLDEPTDGLDPVSSKKIRELIVERSKKGTAVLLTTHDMFEADRLSDRVAFINEGKFYAVDTPENLKQMHGSRSASVRLKEGDQIIEKRVPLDLKDSGDQLKEAVGDGAVLTIHTEEASLEDIFIKMTGRGL